MSKNKIDNPNAFKHWINKNSLLRLSASLQSVYPSFDKTQFMSIAAKLEALELKPRAQLIRDQLYKQLPKNYPRALKILLKSLSVGDLKGFELWPYAEFIQTHGLDDLQISLQALERLTPFFTAEFAVRPFIIKYPEQTLRFLFARTKSPSVDVRRWVSEGTRPRLPWGQRLEIFINNPKLVLPHLEQIKHDDQLYVRKSIANHLNDISKDHPDLVVGLLRSWQKVAGPEHAEKINWITRHALRTLIKSGNSKALELVGVSQNVDIYVGSLLLAKKRLVVDQRLEFSFTLKSLAKKPQKIVVDYVLHFVKANGATSAKVFKFKTFLLNSGQAITLSKSHHLKRISTRKYYSGQHYIQIQINGKLDKKVAWTLRV